MTFTRINKPEFKTLSERITDALKDIGDEYGVDFSINGGTVGTTATFKLNAAVRDAGNGVPAAQQTWNDFCGLYGLRKEWFGQTVVFNGQNFKVAGLLTGRTKNCVELLRSDGQGFITSPSAISSQLNVSS